MKLIEKRSNEHPALPKVLSLTTYFFDVLKMESKADRRQNISTYANHGNIFHFHYILMPVLHNGHFSLYVSWKKIYILNIPLLFFKKNHFNTFIILQVFDNEKMILRYYDSMFTQRPPFLKQLRYLPIIFFDELRK